MIQLMTIFSVLFFIPQAWGAPRQYQIDSKFFYQGKKMSSPRLVTTEGRKAKVLQSNQTQQHEFSVEMVPTLMANKQVRIQYSLVFKQGLDETISRGQVFVSENKNGRISIDHGRIQLYLTVKES